MYKEFIFNSLSSIFKNNIIVIGEDQDGMQLEVCKRYFSVSSWTEEGDLDSLKVDQSTTHSNRLKKSKNPKSEKAKFSEIVQI